MDEGQGAYSVFKGSRTNAVASRFSSEVSSWHSPSWSPHSSSARATTSGRDGAASRDPCRRMIQKLVEQIESRFAEHSEQMSDPE